MCSTDWYQRLQSAITSEEFWRLFEDAETEFEQEFVLMFITMRTHDLEDLWQVFNISADRNLQMIALAYIARKTSDPEEVEEVIKRAQKEYFENVADLAVEIQALQEKDMLRMMPDSRNDCWALFHKTNSNHVRKAILSHILTHNPSYWDAVQICMYGRAFPTMHRCAFELLSTIKLSTSA